MKDVGSGMSVDVRNRLDTRKRKGQMSVRSGMSVGVGKRLDLTQGRGKVEGASGRECVD